MRDEDIPEPPPVPAHHPAGKFRIREALRIPAFFYVEILSSALALLALAWLLSLFAPTYVPVLVLAAAVVLLGACVWRMVKKVIQARAKGRPPLEATIIFWLTLVLPLAAAGWYAAKTVKSYDPMRERQQEAKNALAKALWNEHAFRTEYGRFTYSIKELAVEQVPGARYVLGFPAACTAKFSVEGTKATWDLLDFTLSKAKKIEVEAFFRSKRAEDCVDPKEGFEIYAVGVLKEDAPLDVWMINDKRELRNLQKGY
ncbi:MAG: hypothetical protein ACXWSD_05700 [Bdellovibrionota bacterium]